MSEVVAFPAAPTPRERLAERGHLPLTPAEARHLLAATGEYLAILPRPIGVVDARQREALCRIRARLRPLTRPTQDRT